MLPEEKARVIIDKKLRNAGWDIVSRNGKDVMKQAEDYAVSPQSWYALWFEKPIPLVYMANGNKIYFKNMLVEDSEYEEMSQMHSPKKMLQIVKKKSEYGALPLLEKRVMRDCQYKAETKWRGM